MAEARVQSSDLRKSCQPPKQKIFRFCRSAIRCISVAIPSHSEGVGRRYQRGTGCGGRGGALDERCQSVRQRRVVLAPHCWRRRWQQYMAHRGERVISRKAIAQGMSDVLRFTCMLMRALLVHIAHEIAGAARIRHSLRLLNSERAKRYLQTSGATRRENAKLY